MPGRIQKQLQYLIMAALQTSALSRMVILHLSIALQAMKVSLIEMTDIAIYTLKEI